MNKEIQVISFAVRFPLNTMWKQDLFTLFFSGLQELYQWFSEFHPEIL